eukprot:7836664-Pyramimonas_sp.AAC.1
MTSASFDGSGVKACPTAGPQQSWTSCEEDLDAWKHSSELKQEQLGPHRKSRGISANATFRNQARLLDMARLSSNPKDETGAT